MSNLYSHGGTAASENAQSSIRTLNACWIWPAVRRLRDRHPRSAQYRIPLRRFEFEDESPLEGLCRFSGAGCGLFDFLQESTSTGPSQRPVRRWTHGVAVSAAKK